MMIGKTIGNLRIVSELGRGGMGIVYLAEHKTLNKKFAVKSLSPALTEDPRFRERFYQEARNQAVLDHPNIVQATDFFEDNQEFFFVMEYVSGQDLGKIIGTKGCLPEEEALSIFKGVLEGLDFAHNKGIIHRDVKPPNIIIDTSGRPRIMDFGIAVMFGSQRLTSTGTTVGSPWYMSPEQITRPQDIDHCSDVYSAGILLYEMLTGDVPFDGKSEFSVKEQQVNAPRPDPRTKNPEIPVQLSKIILKAIEKDPTRRFQGCAEFLDYIKEYEAGKVQPPEPSRKWLMVSLAAIAIVGAGVALYTIFFQPPRYDTGERLRQARKAAALLMAVGSKEAAILCRQFVEIDVIRDNLEIAGTVGERELEEKYKNQIRDKVLNIRDGLSKYNDTIEKLAAIEESVVDAQLGHYLKSLKSLEKRSLSADEVAERVRIGRIVRRHTRKIADSGGNVDKAGMRRACMTR
ncbi:MAG: serine/threonine protein kinase [Desulfobacteraceae bacterium]|nr:serine/threonine protein kinase [Desulfobacteraceae bacterium]